MTWKLLSSDQRTSCQSATDQFCSLAKAKCLCRMMPVSRGLHATTQLGMSSWCLRQCWIVQIYEIFCYQVDAWGSVGYCKFLRFFDIRWGFQFTASLRRQSVSGVIFFVLSGHFSLYWTKALGGISHMVASMHMVVDVPLPVLLTISLIGTFSFHRARIWAFFYISYLHGIHPDLMGWVWSYNKEGSKKLVEGGGREKKWTGA